MSFLNATWPEIARDRQLISYSMFIRTENDEKFFNFRQSDVRLQAVLFIAFG